MYTVDGNRDPLWIPIIIIIFIVLETKSISFLGFRVFHETLELHSNLQQSLEFHLASLKFAGVRSNKVGMASQALPLALSSANGRLLLDTGASRRDCVSTTSRIGRLPTVSSRAPKHSCSYMPIRAARRGAPPIMPAVISPSGATDLATLMLRNRVVFIGSPVNSEVRSSARNPISFLCFLLGEWDWRIAAPCACCHVFILISIRKRVG